MQKGDDFSRPERMRIEDLVGQDVTVVIHFFFGTLETESPWSLLEPRLRDFGVLLCLEEPLRRKVLRKEGKEALSLIGVTGGKELIDAAVQSALSHASDLGGRVIIEDVEQWDDEVDGAEVLEELLKIFEQHLHLPQYASEALALWTLYTYVFAAGRDSFEVAPKVILTSPTKRCGKTRCLSVLRHLAARTIGVDSITAAALFRVIHQAHPVLLIDEADTYLKENEELRGILNSSFHADGQVIRTVGDHHEPRSFETFAPNVIAAISRLPDTIQDRGLVIRLQRKPPATKLKPFRRRVAREEWRELRQKCARWAWDHVDDLVDWRANLPYSENDRAIEIWEVLAAIGEAAEWPRLVPTVHFYLSQTEDVETYGLMLLSDIRRIFEERNNPDRLATTDILEELERIPERPWKDFRRGKPISDRQLARFMKDFEIRSKIYRFADGSRGKGYGLKACEAAFASYLSAAEKAETSLDLEDDEREEIG